MTDKKRYTIARGTATYDTFERVFFLDEAKYPYRFPVTMTKGRAINLTMGLNRCNMQYSRERGIPDSGILYSAKSIDLGNGQWTVEISTNYTRQGVAPPSRRSRTPADMESILVGIDIDLAKDDKDKPKAGMDDLLGDFLKG